MFVILSQREYNALQKKANPVFEEEVDKAVADRMLTIRLNMGKILETHLKMVGKFNPKALYEELNDYLEKHV
jgi:predicted component of type VI protein secretion system